MRARVLQFFGLQREPFSIAPDPRYLYLSERHREALAHLLYGVQAGGGFVLLTGEIGAGKTTVCRALLQQLPRHCNVAYIFDPLQSAAELLESICAEFHVVREPSGSRPGGARGHVAALNAFLLHAHAQRQDNVLIIDEAQKLSAEVLEQLRLLTNLETNERKLLQIILIGQPELRELLARPELEQLAQRVIARYHLGALGRDETLQYVAHRLGVAGLRDALPFDAAALQRVHALSQGVPRRINLLCERALLGAYALGKAQIDAAIVEQAAAEVRGELPRAGRSNAGRSNWGSVRLRIAAAVAMGVLAGAAVFGLGLLDLQAWRAIGAATASALR
jgi:general secretion pathway protein A